MTIDTIIDDMQAQVDEDAQRWTDAKCLVWVKKAIRRANHVIRKNKLNMGKTYQAYSVSSSNYQNLALPTDFLALASDDCLFRTDTGETLRLKTFADWESVKVGSGVAVSMWLLDEINRTFDIREVPTSTITCNLWYMKKIDPSAYTGSTESPWNGDLDDLIAEYGALRCLNYDENDISADTAILKEFENAIIETFTANTKNVYRSAGWNNVDGY